MSKINRHIKSEHVNMSPKSSDKQSDEKSLDFSAIGKILSAVIPSSRGNNNF